MYVIILFLPLILRIIVGEIPNAASAIIGATTSNRTENAITKVARLLSSFLAIQDWSKNRRVEAK